MKNKEIKNEYCNEFGHSSFNKYNENDYSKWLEEQLLIQRVSQRSELLSQYTEFLNWKLPVEREIKLTEIKEFFDWLNCG